MIDTTNLKRELFTRLLKKQGLDVARAIPRRGEAGNHELSFAQRRLWFLDQFAPGNAAYNIPAAFRLEGRLDVAVLQQSFNEIVKRHSILRTIFTTDESKPIQIVLPSLKIELPVVDLRPFDKTQALTLMSEESHRPFDLKCGPLLRVCLLQLHDEEHILLLTMHHIIADGWSLSVFLRELSAFYDAGVKNKIAVLPELTIQYSDFASWERERLQSDLFEKQLAYWKNKLAVLPPALPLPSDFPRPATQSFRGARHEFALSVELTESLKSLSRREDCTLFMTLLAAFQTFLFRYTAQDDIAVGTSITNHNQVETERLIGLFINTLVLRTDLLGNPSFRQLLQRVREVTLEAYAHQDLPFEKLVEELQPERELSHSPLFQVMFLLQNGPTASLKLPGLKVSLIDRHNGTAKFDLLLTMVEDAEVLTGSLEYNTDLFAAETIERLCNHFQTLLQAIVEEPERAVNEFQILTPAEQDRLLIEWNDTASDYSSVPLVYQQFEAQAASDPDNVAIVFDAEQLTYGELNARANQLAHALRRLGVGPDVLVGLLTERSLDTVIGLLGILKAGGAYLPLDPHYPRTRLTFMLEDSSVPVLLTQQHLSEDLPPHQAEVLCLDSEWQHRVAHESTENLPAQNLGQHLAYTIYTSGSTGQPKGVQISHRALVNFLSSMRQAPGINANDTLLSVTTLSFDIAGLEIFLPLVNGARLVLASRETAQDGRQLAQLIDSSNATIVQATPATWRLLLEAQWPGSKQLKLLCGGEALPDKLASILLDHGASLWNLYGPTETTIWSALTKVETVDRAVVEIGRPIANTQLFILNSSMQPVPVGVAGELFIGGAGVARGYLNQPVLTAERFIPNPFSTEQGTRLYRTGDLVRYLPDGAIEYLGRNDHQVKVRGHRIELGEIESVLTQHPAVLQGVVMARATAAGDVRLVAYVIPTETESWPGEGELRSFLSERLPGFMVPSTFMLMEAFPLTPNAKVDRKSLPEPDWSQTAVTTRTFVAPRTPFEEVLAGIWSEILGIERVGINDNFFELGGHSLLATTFVSRVRDVFQVELPLRRLFETPTLAGIAEAVQSIKQDEKRIETAPLIAETRPAELPLSFSQERLWCLEQLTPGTTAYNLVGALSLRGVLKVAALSWSLNEIVKRHEVLRTTFVTIDGSPAQVIAPSVTITLPVEHVTAADRDVEIDRLIAEEARFSFNLTSGPLLRARLLELDEYEHVLILNMHHIISDGWSIGILFRELTAFYKAFVQGEPVVLPELPIQYADFSLWQRHRAVDRALESQLSYWKHQLEGALPILELPADKQRARVQTYEGERQAFDLSTALTSDLKAFSQREGVTVFMTLLAVFKTLLHRLTNEHDIVVGSPIAGRNRAETENLIGFFVNTLVLRTDFSGNPTFRAVLQRVRETALGAYSNQDVTFEQLLEVLQPERDMSHTPLFQVFFNMLNFEENTIELPGLTTSVLPPSEVMAKFDLTLYIEEENQQLRFAFVYNQSRFSNERIAEMGEQLRQLLAAVIAQPEANIGSLSLVTPTATKSLPQPTGELRPSWSGPVHVQFAEQARRSPSHQAVVDRREAYTYQELDARSNQVAQYLLAHGVERQDVVAIYAERNASLVVALLGIIKSGAAFMVLDPAYPPARLLYYLETIRPKGWIQIHEAGTPHATLQEYADGFSFSLDLCSPSQANDSLDNYSTSETGVAIEPQDLAYIAFTSGSSGRPKAIAGKHGSLAHFAPWARRMFGIGHGDRYTMLSGISHDPLHRDVFVPLQLGATICIPDSEDLTVPTRLANWIEKQQITVSNLTPAMGQVIGQAVSEKRDFQLSSLRYLFFVGDVLTRRDTARLRTLAPAANIINLYGTTETSRAVSYYIVPPEETTAVEGVDLRKEILPLGHGITEVQLLVINTTGKQAGVGEPGEICFRSPHLAKGYWGDEQLTREKFVSNPFTADPYDVLYRTGDLGRYLPDGDVEALGRADHQVKIRGFRIELGEIESVLGRHRAVHECAVIAREDVPGEKRLVAYVVPTVGDAPSLSELRLYLKSELPDYMMPAAFVMLDQLPLTPNRKLDRRALPAPVQAQPETDDGLLESRNAVEEILADTFAVVLGVEHIGLQDNFFDLGGHSLMAIQLMGRVMDVLHVQLPVRTLFESPTVSALAEAVESARKTDRCSIRKPLIAQSREGALPLSFAQQRLWFLDQFQPGLGVYNIPAAVRLSGMLNLDALEQSLNAIVSRHESLRTTFAFANGQPEQLIAPSLTIKLAQTNLETLPEDVQAKEIERLMLLEARQAFDLVHGPLLRASLLRLREDEHVLVFTIHHIVSDAWSLGVLVRELCTLYEAFAEGIEPALAPLPVQYADYTLWQRELMQGDLLEAQLNYWREKLGGQLPILELPTDRPRPPVQSFQGAKETFTISTELSEQLNLLCRQEGVTLFMLLLAAFQTLLYRYSGQTDVLVGTPIAGRERKEIQNLIGFFVNTLVMRNTLSGALSFKELLALTREAALDAYAHQDVPFEKIVEELRLDRDTSREALFQVMFILQNAPAPVLELKGLSLEPLPIHNHTAKFDLVLSIYEEGERLRGTLEYSTDLFDKTTIERIAGHFETLLQSIAANSEQQLDDLPLLTAQEEHRLLFALNDTDKSYPVATFVHQQFEAQAERTPAATALIAGAEQLTYKELNERANKLAHHLLAFGLAREDRVGILLDRSAEMVVALLGVLKAGGCYVPLDPQYPAERLSFMMEDAGLSVLLTTRELSESLGLTYGSLQLVYLDETAGITVNPDIEVSTAQLAYLIYTSGSTGKPKGVMVSHGALCNLLHSMGDEPGLTAEDRFLAVTTLSFDIAALELFLPLIKGARLVLATRETASDPVQLMAQMKRQEATVMQATPATWRMLLDSGWNGAPRIKMLCGGEALPFDLAQALTGCGESLWNMYGPTETTIWSLVSGVRKDERVTIGRPISNTTVYVLDKRLQPVPTGVAGELYIGGTGVARGYWQRPMLTAEKFIPNPFSSEPGARLYHTGDTVRYLPTGELEYLGRVDHQVKIRGYRIELGEIETALRRHSGVREAVVVAREQAGEEKRLVAYVVANEDAALSGSELRAVLKDQLPAYMVPAHFVFLDELPLTPNGKVNRRALPAPVINTTPTESTGTALNQMEDILADIWANVLGLERVSRDDDFFDLGGHSLLATQLVYRIQETFGVALPLRRVFEEPTVAGAAKIIEHLMRTGSAPVLPQIERVERNRELPLSFAQQRLWILDQFAPHTYNERSAIRLTGPLSLPALEQSLNEVIRRHEILRTTFAAVEGRPSQIIAPSLALTLPLIDLRHLTRREADAQVSRLIVQEFRRRFNLAEGPLLKALVLRLDQNEHVVLLSLPHIVFDGWSNAILVHEVSTLYQAFLDGLSSPLPELPVQYADFAVWQREWLQSEILETHLAYWKQQLEGAPLVLELPVDKTNTQISTARGASLPFHFPAALTDDLKVLSRQHGVTLFMTLLTAFKIVLHSYSGQMDIVVGTNVANRTRSETEKLIGFFVNLLVLRTDLSNAPSFRELLWRVREVTLKALAHQDLPFEKLISELRLERDHGQTPLVRAVMQLQTAPQVALKLKGLTEESLEIGTESVPFDLVLNMSETNDGLTGAWLYNTDLFNATTIARMSSRFSLLLNQLIAEPDMKLDEIVARLIEAERQKRQALQEEFKSTRRMKLRNVQLQPVIASGS
ncbi:MAG TPA: amino acid adenylation domain-containing protein [Pyrinomonadaceae bacterium]|nr:amino acid adenylation domain-containing protein [Pyrinomonadaceae bacterium]